MMAEYEYLFTKALHDKLKGKIIATINCWVDSDDNLCVDIIRHEEKTFKVRISNFSRKIMYNWSTDDAVKDVVDKYKRFVLKYYFK